MNRVELVTKLELVGRALADNNRIPIFEHFCFTGSHVFANNDNLAIIAPCETSHPFAIKGHTLLGLLRASQSEDVTFKVGDQQEVQIKAGKSNFKLPYFPKEQFLFKEPTEKWKVVVDIDPVMLGAIEACLQTASRDADTQAAFVGVWLKRGGTLYSCDGDALSRFSILPAKQVGDYMMPNAFCETVLRVGTTGGKLTLNDGWARATLDEFVIYGRLIKNDDPLDHEKLIYDTLKGVLVPTPIPEGLDHALERARVVADPESKPTQLSVQDGNLHLLTDTSLGIVRDVLPFQHPDVVALVSAGLMQRSVKLTTEMAIMTNCCVFRNNNGLWQLLSNFG